MSLSENLSLLIDDAITHKLRDILIGCIAIIESHDTVKMTADVKPLLFRYAGGIRQDYPVLPDIPVLYHNAGGYIIRPKYRKGDEVWVSFATHDIGAPLRGLPGDTGLSLFHKENACVVCGIGRPKNFQGMQEDGILISHENGGMSLLLTQDKIVAATPVFEIRGNLNVTGEISWQSATTPTRASTHIHPTGIGPTAAPTAGS